VSDRTSTTGEPVLHELAPAECRRLLGAVPIGRLAFTVDALPTIEPVHFTVRGDEVLIPTRLGGKVAAASRGAVVAFEVDDFDPGTRTGWSVTVVGPSRVVTDAPQVAAMHSDGLAPWAPAPVACVVAVRIARVTGRRITRPEVRPARADRLPDPVETTRAVP
jgi:nitroimidazol reductase NimA-like FMN-containing flavoprotein (pyridoxamine 5'-phosphate oxidase superfamily)